MTCVGGCILNHHFQRYDVGIRQTHTHVVAGDSAVARMLVTEGFGEGNITAAGHNVAQPGGGVLVIRLCRRGYDCCYIRPPYSFEIRRVGFDVVLVVAFSVRG